MANVLYMYLNPHPRECFSWFWERKKERLPNRGSNRNLGMCPEHELNPQLLFGVQDNTPTIWAPPSQNDDQFFKCYITIMKNQDKKKLQYIRRTLEDQTCISKD